MAAPSQTINQREAVMGSYKTAAPCEVCGHRCSHTGSNRGFVVGRTIKNTPRLVHDRCRSRWRVQKETIMAGWTELRPEVLSTLSPDLRHRIERCLAEQPPRGVKMARPPMMKRYEFSDVIRESIIPYIRIELNEFGKLKKGFVIKLYDLMRREHPSLMPKKPDEVKYYYAEFLKLVHVTVTLVEQRTPAPESAAPMRTAETPIVSSPAAVVMGDDDLPAMATAVNALTALALKRQDREALQLALEAMSHLLQPPKKISTA